MNDMQQMQQLKTELMRFMLSYKFALHEVNTKIDILKEEFQYIHDYNPIEHVASRLKSPDSILKKLYRKNYELSLDSISENIRDIAGIRITCSFISDIYEIVNMLQSQRDITVVECKDYIKNPKPNGYRSFHLIIQIPIFMSDRVDHVYVEIQIRTMAMDFWASLEHKIFYKYNHDIPEKLKQELKESALIAANLDTRMEKIQKEVNKLKNEYADDEGENLREILVQNERFHLPDAFLKLGLTSKITE